MEIGDRVLVPISWPNPKAYMGVEDQLLPANIIKISGALAYVRLEDHDINYITNLDKLHPLGPEDV